jgi:hypothetical protein
MRNYARNSRRASELLISELVSELLMSELVSELIMSELLMTRGAFPPIGWLSRSPRYGALLRHFPSVLYQPPPTHSCGLDGSHHLGFLELLGLTFLD